jgi:uncharacterized PurR-regulated membrane protein YhhQ (DUF165 family)
MIGLISFFAFVGTVPLGNWMVGNFGTVCPPDSPCLIPVGFGLMAPSGVLVIGLALVLRDIIHHEMGPAWALLAIAVGSLVSFVLAPAALVVASAAAFLLSELADFAVYTPLHRRRMILAVLASGVVGAIVDSAVFLSLAFGSLQFLPGQVVGKLWASLIAALAIIAISVLFRRRSDLQIQKGSAKW